MTVDWRTPDRQPQACFTPHDAPLGLEIHHIPGHQAHNPDELARTCQRVYDYHVHSQGMDDIWYQHVVALDGSLAVGRGFDCASYTDVDHDGDIEQVPRHTVALVGDYDHAQVTHAQRVALGRLEQRVIERGGGRDHSYHAARSATACPGSNVIAALNSGVLTQPPPSEEDDMAYLFRVRGDDNPQWLTNDILVRLVDKDELARVEAKYGQAVMVDKTEVEHIPVVGKTYERGPGEKHEIFKVRLG